MGAIVPGMTRCTVRLLGGFEVLVDGRVVPSDAWRSRRSADLVKVLALQPSHALHREQMMALLWPELGAEAAAANLRKAVHYARRAMCADEAIRSEAGMLSLWGGQVDVDAERFLAAADAALGTGEESRCAHAAALYAGDAVPADRYERWAAEPRQRLRERHLAVLKAARMWQRVLDLEPTDEQSHRELMRQHLRAGRRRDAIRQFERLRDALREHVGVGPDPNTIALYEQVLALEGPQPPEPCQRAAVLIATGLVHLNRREFGAAEQLARQARDVALDAGLAHELGDASTLLALVSSWTGRWHEVFRQEFTAALTQRSDLSLATYDANLCFAEFHLAGADPVPDAETYAREMLTLADAADSTPGRGVAHLMLGEAHLLAGQYEQARERLRQARRTNAAAHSASVLCVSLERLAQAEIALAHRDHADELLARARPAAETSPIRSHLLVRLLGVGIQAAADPHHALSAVIRAERTLIDTTRICEPCSMDFRVQATIACAQAGDVPRARHHLADAERIAGLWQGGPWTAAVWEARATLRYAEGQPNQAAAFLYEAADEYARAQRHVDERRCRAAASAGRQPRAARS